MLTTLERLARFVTRRSWWVIAAWAVAWTGVVVAVGAAGVRLGSDVTIPNTETQRVTEELARTLDTPTGVTAPIVWHTTDKTPFTDAQRTAITAALADVSRVQGVAAVIDPFVATAKATEQATKLSDGKTQLTAAAEQLKAGKAQLAAAIEQARAAGVYDAQAATFAQQQKTLDAQAAELTAREAQLRASEALLRAAAPLTPITKDGTAALALVQFPGASAPDAVRAAVDRALTAAHVPGVTTEFNADRTVGSILGVSELIGVLLALLVLVLVLRGIVPALLPIITSIAAVGLTVSAALLWSRIADLNVLTPALAVMLGLAVGIDYALFIVNRHRRQLRESPTLAVTESIAQALGTAGTAVFFAGLAVAIALTGLTLTGLPLLAGMGLIAAATVTVAVLAAFTLAPALLDRIGLRVLTRRERAARAAAQETATQETAAQSPSAQPATPTTPVRPFRTWAALTRAAVGIAILAVIALPGLTLRLGVPNGATESSTSSAYRTQEAVSTRFGPGFTAPLVVVAHFTDPSSGTATLQRQADVATRLAATANVTGVAPADTTADGRTLVFQVIPHDDANATATADLVRSLRSQGFDVAGATSGFLDLNDRFAAALPVYLAVVVGLSLIILLVMFRSLLVPVLATAGFLLSYAAALGAVTAVYQWGWLGAVFEVEHPGPLTSVTPILILGVLFGLAMDYQVFVGAGMREAVAQGHSARQSVVLGIRHGQTIVIAAAAIMIAVFGGFVFADLPSIRPIGFGLAVGILFDAYVVRLIILPGLLHLLGRSAWWLPRWLGRILPRVDIEPTHAQTLSAPGSTAQARPIDPLG